MKRVLVIAYYFPPMGLSGVQRIARFVKYLPDNGWTPTVLTVEPGGYFAFDQSLLDELKERNISIERTPTIDPTRFFRRKSQVTMPRESSRSILSAMSQFFFVPDNKIGWYAPAARRALKLHRQAPFDCVLATCPPYTCSLIARRVSRSCQIPYVLDFRDDWLGNPRHVYPTFLHKKLHKALEDKAFASASSILTINKVIAGAMKERHPRKAGVIEVLRQGYDAEDFSREPRKIANNRLSLLYAGIFYDAQTPDHFLRALARFLDANPLAREEIEAGFVGLLPGASQRLILDLGLNDVTKYHGYLPHDAVIAHLEAADVLWMTVGSGPGQASISTGKLYEYMGARKPILGLAPDGAARDELRAYGAAFLAYPEDVDEICSRLETIYGCWKSGSLPAPSSGYVDSFDRRVITAELADLLDRIGQGIF